MDKRKLEVFFEMSGGYYLDYSNNSLEAFIADIINIALYDEKYHYGSGSKANRIRAIWDLESNHVVGKLIRETIEHDDDERLLKPYLKKRDAELKDHCLKIAERLEASASSEDKFQSGFPQTSGINTQPAFRPTPDVSVQAAFQPQQNAQQQLQSQTAPQQQYVNPPFRQQITNAVKKNKVFIVHGHDDLVKEQVARFVTQVGLKPVILHEQASSSRTIIEKIEKYADQVVFAIVLYTPCDQGSKRGESHQLPRARQNVIFEHGYFIAKLGRENVTAIVKGNVEKPNDISGVVYEIFDENGAWKFKLAKEMKASGCQIDMNNII
jgi:predicted nucleotide-binding protein